MCVDEAESTAQDRFEEALGLLREDIRSRQGAEAGEMTAWVVAWAEVRRDSDGELVDTVGLESSRGLSPWQQVGLLAAAQALVNGW
jgi:cation transport regulator ChaB